MSLDDSETKLPNEKLVAPHERYIQAVEEVWSTDMHPFRFLDYHGNPDHRQMMFRLFLITKWFNKNLGEFMKDYIKHKETQWPEIVDKQIKGECLKAMPGGIVSFEKYIEDLWLPSLIVVQLQGIRRKHLSRRTFDSWKFKSRRPGTTLYNNWMSTMDNYFTK